MEHLGLELVLSGNAGILSQGLTNWATALAQMYLGHN